MLSRRIRNHLLDSIQNLIKLKVLRTAATDVSELSIFVDGRKIAARFHVAHRISNAGYGLDRLHGHTYEIRLNLSGSRDAAFLFPFEEMMAIMSELATSLNNKVLLPVQGGNVVKTDDGSITFVSADGRRYIFPKGDVVTLPLSEVTAEALANYILGEIRGKIKRSGVKTDSITGVELTLWEGNERGVEVRSTL